MARPDAARRQRPPATTPELEELAEHLNRRERSIAFAEGRLRRRRILEFLARRAAASIQGVVLRAVADGLLVNLPGYLISGFIEGRSLGPGARLAAPHAYAAGGRTFRPGMEVTVRIRRIDPAAGELDLALA